MRDIFSDLFVLEMASNHLGSIDRGLRIIRDFGRIVRYNNVKAALKLQLRNVDTFIHKDFRDRQDIRYIKKTLDTKMSEASFHVLANAIRRQGCIVCATPFDEASVRAAVRIGCKILKVASSDLNDWGLLEEIAATKLPVIASVGGSSLADMDNLVLFFKNRNIPLALNHCVSLYPTNDDDLEINQIDFMRDRYPEITIGFSTHEFTDWETSIAIAYAKGARTFERHVDILTEDVKVSPYCSTPSQVDMWFRAHARAKAMCGAPGTDKRIPPRAEVAYLDALVRGLYANKDLPVGHVIERGDLYLAVPLQKGQLSCRELLVDDMLTRPLLKDEPLTINHLDNVYGNTPAMRAFIEARGL
jgi:sialic acid synthase SpsE